MGAREGCGIGQKVTPEADHEAKYGSSAREHKLVLGICWLCLKSPPRHRPLGGSRSGIFFQGQGLELPF